MGILERVADKDTVFVVLEYHFFLQYYTTYTIDGRGNFVTVKLSDVLVTFRTVVVALILVESKIELCSMLDDCHVERRKQHVVLVVEFRHGYHEQSVILARVAVNNSGT